MEKRRTTQFAGIVRSTVARFSLEIAPDTATAVNIAEVKISDDFRYADVFVSAVSGAESAVKILKSRMRDISKAISAQTSTYAIPLIRFHVDRRGEELAKLDSLLESL